MVQDTDIHICIHPQQTLGFIAKYKPKRVILTHIGAMMDYERLLSMLPGGVEVA